MVSCGCFKVICTELITFFFPTVGGKSSLQTLIQANTDNKAVLARNQNGTPSTNSHIISDLVYASHPLNSAQVLTVQIRSYRSDNPLFNVVHLPQNDPGPEKGLDWNEG